MFKCHGSTFDVCWTGDTCHITQRFDGGVDSMEIPITHVSKLVKELTDAALECARARGKAPERLKS